ncbi:MAG: efflux RND transporter permease subunit [Ignavibacteria bacterium]|nr:efflux RND transporter permease subunit [Ignavibacteria bacterium]
MFLAKLATKRPVLTTTIILVFIVFGLFAYFTLKLDIMPEVKIPFVTITTVYPGAGPKEVENLVTKPIEDAISTISGIERIESFALESVSITIIEFSLGKDIDVANREVKDQIDIILNKLPRDVEKPLIQKVDIQAFPIIDLIVTGNLSPIELYDIVDRDVRDKLARVSGVANVEVVGGQERAIQVKFDNRTIYENMISLPQMVQILKAYNIDLPGGSFQTSGDEFTVRVKGEYPTLAVLQKVRVPTAYGIKTLDQLARIIDTGKSVSERAIYFDVAQDLRSENVVRISIIKSADANAVQVSEAITEVLPEIQKILPSGVQIIKIYDRSTFIRSTFDDTMSNIYLGVIFTGLVLFLFLFSLRSTLVLAITMPVSIISSFLLFRTFGVTLNMLSLMGISVSLGVLVANSVVVLENIFRYKSLGYSIKDSAYLGTKEVTVAVLAATMTNLIVFLPIANMTSIVGQFLKDLALAATFATIFSLLYSFTLTPMLASFFLKQNEKGNAGFFTQLYHKIDNFLKNSYQFLLEKVLKTKLISAITIIFVFIGFLASLVLIAPKIGFEFMPKIDEGIIQIQIELPENTNLEMTTQKVNEIINKIKHNKEISSIICNIGKKDNLNTGSNLANITIQLVNAKERDISSSQMVDILRKNIENVTNILATVQQTDQTAGGREKPIQFYLLGDDIDSLEVFKEKIVEAVKDTPGLLNFDNSSRKGKPEISIYPKRELLVETGLTIVDLAYTVRSAIEGIQSTTFREGANEYDIIVTLEEDDVDLPEKIGNITVVSQNGTYRLSQLAEIDYSLSTSRVLHRDKYKAIQFTGTNAPNYPLGNLTQEIQKRIDSVILPAGYTIKWGGNVKMMQEMFKDMLIAFFVATFLTYMLLSAILESFIQPIYIMTTLPLGLIGAFWGLYLTNTTYNLPSLMGFIMLIGIVVNNAILILDATNQYVRESGYEVKRALVEAAVVKLKPQIMSAFALILGMLPMALQIGETGKEFRSPLGIVAIGGLITATLLTIFIIPAFYYIFHKEKKVKKSEV